MWWLQLFSGLRRTTTQWFLPCDPEQNGRFLVILFKGNWKERI
jgi:hypothetical protein